MGPTAAFRLQHSTFTPAAVLIHIHTSGSQKVTARPLERGLLLVSVNHCGAGMSKFIALQPVVAVCHRTSLCLTCKCPDRNLAIYTLYSTKGFKAVIAIGFEISFTVNWFTVSAHQKFLCPDAVQNTDLSCASLLSCLSCVLTNFKVSIGAKSLDHILTALH